MDNNSNNIIIILDLGHGGINEKKLYTTSPNKMFKHKNGEVAYEGVINREIGKLVDYKLKLKGYNTVFTVQPNDFTDVPLKERVKFSKRFNKNNSIFVSFHSNASISHKGKGLELYTTKGQTKSDILAEYIGQEWIKDFPNIKFRADKTDGDVDKESQHYVTRKTLCPAVLLEILFFDNQEDWQLLKDKTFLNAISESTAKGIIKYINNYV